MCSFLMDSWRKRKAEDIMDPIGSEARMSPFIPMFEMFRSELDEHHDRRERIIKSSRDVTAASKKIVRTLNHPIPAAISKANQPHYEAIRKLLSNSVSELKSINAYRYNRQISPGIQEYMESRVFHHYLETQTLLSHEQASAQLNELVASHPDTQDGGAEESEAQRTILLTPEDYLLGIFDATGELMRFAITFMATSGTLPVDSERTVLHDLQALRLLLCTLEAKADFDFHMARDVRGKLAVMLASVDKVEKALYGLIIRGSERPKGWMPDLRENNRAEVDAEV